jgi:hypothetical protein
MHTIQNSQHLGGTEINVQLGEMVEVNEICEHRGEVHCTLESLTRLEIDL